MGFVATVSTYDGSEIVATLQEHPECISANKGVLLGAAVLAITAGVESGLAGWIVDGLTPLQCTYP